MSNFQFRLGEDENGNAVRMDLPTLIETRLFDLASSGGGKSYALRVLIEKTAEHVQWIIIDPEGEFSSLREKFDFLLVGHEGEIPVDARSAKLLARKIMETRASVIVDLYGLGKTGIDWTANFLPELMSLPKNLWSPVIVAIDEAHKFARESTKGKETEPPAITRQAVITLSDSGRKQARGCVIATQRLTKLAADARAELRNNLIGLTVQDIDRERAADILGIPNRSSGVLRELGAGEFFAFGPAFVSHRGVFKMKVDTAITRHPRPGQGKLLAVPKASEAVKELLGQMGDVPTQAQAEVDALTFAQRQVIELRRQLSDSERAFQKRPVEITPAEPTIEYIDRPVLNGEVKDFIASADLLRETLNAFPARMAEALTPALAPVVSNLALVLEKIALVQNAQSKAPTQPRGVVSHSAPRPSSHFTGPITNQTTARPQPKRVLDMPGDKLPEGELKILKVCAQFPDGATRKQLTVLTGYKHSTRDAYIARLRVKGYVSSGERIRPTDEGLNALPPDFEPLPTGNALQHYWLDHLPIGEKVIFEMALEAHPQWLEKSALDDSTPFKRSTRDAYISRMVAKQIIDERTGAIRASDELFD